MHLRVPFLVPTAVAALLAAMALPTTPLPTTTPAVTTLPVTTLPSISRSAFTLPVTWLVTTPSVTAADPGLLPHTGTNPATANGTTAVTDTHTAVPTDTPRAGSPAWKPAFTFTWPLSPRPAIHRRFEQPPDEWARGHRGVDLLAAVGQPVLSAGEGIVAFSGVVAGRGVLTVRHSGGLRTTYEPVDDRLASGALVHRGSRIGAVSPTAGHCVPLTCLHWGAISGQTYRDPLSLLGFGPPILLPLG
jgi:murein DD-endopeptidase MepM/ murein hydrolase activator NlpD